MIKLPYNHQLAEAGASVKTEDDKSVVELSIFRDITLTGNTLFYTVLNGKSVLQTTPDSGVLHHEVTGIWLGFSANFLETQTWFSLDRLLKVVRANADAYEGWKFVWISSEKLEEAKPHQELW